MLRNLLIIALAALVVGLPFIFRREAQSGDWQHGDPRLIVISPHNEAIRYEFARAFSDWHRDEYGQAVKVEWRIVGGTSEILRYLDSEFTASFQAWWKAQGGVWPAGGGSMILDRRFDPDEEPADPKDLPRREIKRSLYSAFRAHDDPAKFGAGIDIFFGGGTYDHGKSAGQGLSVPVWPPDEVPPGIVATADGAELIPERLSGEIWRTQHFYGTAVSTFGICYNKDRLADLGIEKPPAAWRDLIDPRYLHELGMADPTKSGSIAKAFEMIIHQQCAEAVAAAGFSRVDADRFEKAIRAADGWPDSVPVAYQSAVERGWLEGLRLVRRIGANARYFTDSSGKVPVDVGAGNVAAGLAIDFYGRYQAEFSRGPDGRERMFYTTPRGGSSVSADPISLLRGAPQRAIAVRFIRFVLGEQGQRLWNFAPGTPGGPEKFALRRLPVRRDFYPSGNRELQRHFEAVRDCCVDDLAGPAVNPFRLAEQFTYHSRWTGRLFSLHRDLIRAMCLDSGQELRAAWEAIVAAGGAEECPQAMAALERMPDRPEPLDWKSAQQIISEHGRLETMRVWTIFFRDQYRRARQLAEEGR